MLESSKSGLTIHPERVSLITALYRRPLRPPRLDSKSRRYYVLGIQVTSCACVIRVAWAVDTPWHPVQLALNMAWPFSATVRAAETLLDGLESPALLKAVTLKK